MVYQTGLAQAYTQMELDEESRQYVAINTHHGLYQYLRLPFGIASAPAVFPPSLSPQQAEMLDPPEQFRVEGTTGDVCNALDQLMGAVRDLVSTYCSSFCTSYRPTWLLPEENKETVSIGTQTQSLRLRAAAVHRLYLTDCAKYVCGGVCVWGYVWGYVWGVCVWGYVCGGYVWGVCVGGYVWGGMCVGGYVWGYVCGVCVWGGYVCGGMCVIFDEHVQINFLHFLLPPHQSNVIILQCCLWFELCTGQHEHNTCNLATLAM